LAHRALPRTAFLDGLAIGLAFRVSTAVGAVAAAVLAHDFSDGINTVGVILRNRGDKRFAFRWLSIDAVATALVLPVQNDVLGFALALLLGASDLLPESYHDHPTAGTTAMTILGLLGVYAAVRLARL
jgi:ZIP family zinc transporter